VCVRACNIIWRTVAHSGTNGFFMDRGQNDDHGDVDPDTRYRPQNLTLAYPWIEQAFMGQPNFYIDQYGTNVFSHIVDFVSYKNTQVRARACVCVSSAVCQRAPVLSSACGVVVAGAQYRVPPSATTLPASRNPTPSSSCRAACLLARVITHPKRRRSYSGARAHRSACSLTLRVRTDAAIVGVVGGGVTRAPLIADAQVISRTILEGPICCGARASTGVCSAHAHDVM
jgi:hypothetical protein